MIVIEKQDHFIMIQQHDHAYISGQIVAFWKKNFLLRSKLREVADWAIQQHDRAWIPLDQNPAWNEEKQRPYSFIDYPLAEKIEAYRRGIEEVEEQSLYAGILCSMHYASFFKEDSGVQEERNFIEEEKNRRSRLFEQMDMDIPEDIYQLHFRRLQFCDDLSLFLCMTGPDVPEEEEVPWFRNGFPQTFDVAPEGIRADWEAEDRISVHPFPFAQPFEVDIPYRRVGKQDISDKGLLAAYQKEEVRHKTVAVVRKQD
ncbi:DUF3891 family protein [Halobacillus sp. ACCC02827]|uniref:DUF3891 family protein n=1 Tax=Halobacillus sp. ACCC02827 TaxID=3052090 RepID=UPI002570821F|nr:DUF3891 family protein [Halobacillus sp. ACCC02827]WJE15853.1 DUF3891 family protein [Halobacillus sp. ACCC02827]